MTVMFANDTEILLTSNNKQIKLHICVCTMGADYWSLILRDSEINDAIRYKILKRPMQFGKRDTHGLCALIPT